MQPKPSNPWFVKRSGIRQTPSNPWTGVSMWKEFKYDLRHPIDLLYRRGWPGLKEAWRELFNS